MHFGRYIIWGIGIAVAASLLVACYAILTTV
jgi:hypothetical protein